MARRKKKEEPVIVEQPKQEPRYLFKVKALNDVAFRKYPSLDKEFITGYMNKERVYDVISIITCAALPFYLLENGSYVIGDGNLLKI